MAKHMFMSNVAAATKNGLNSASLLLTNIGLSFAIRKPGIASINVWTPENLLGLVILLNQISSVKKLTMLMNFNRGKTGAGLD